ncbi:uncharacterized protein LOC18432313 [Amborella trichopoda]|uniref:uncharacterized protein LOC18432313 n=1 Tax=Amborella trichopoda TaxID=13333 RepID=UPI0009BDA7A2|nr:uncharacterized protein LOC18432313 [Amborella trichopoda]|eukprot:XP_020521689.1 uncharacterized protein LOC18432313 [Amborella trichopoda]
MVWMNKTSQSRNKLIKPHSAEGCLCESSGETATISTLDKKAIHDHRSFNERGEYLKEMEISEPSSVTTQEPIKEGIQRVAIAQCNLRKVGQETNGESSLTLDLKNKGNASQIVEDEFQEITPGKNGLCLLGVAACLTLGNGGILQEIKDSDKQSHYQMKLTNSSDLPPLNTDAEKSTLTVLDKIPESNSRSCQQEFRSLSLGLPPKIPNVEPVNHFRPRETFDHLKGLNHEKLKDTFDTESRVSGCGSSKDPIERWQALKQNSNLLYCNRASISRRASSNTRPHSKKAKNDAFKQRLELAKKEQTNRFAKIAAPSGLLSGLNPGIINHVRNSKQVHSIIEAMVKSEKGTHLQGGNSEVKSSERKCKYHGLFCDQGVARLDMSENSSITKGDEHTHELFGSKRTEDWVNTCGFSRGINDMHASWIEEKHRAEGSIKSQPQERERKPHFMDFRPNLSVLMENTRSMKEFSTNHDSIITLSVKAAMVASHWLELLSMDICGRLAALKRSKMRVRDAIQMLPSILPGDISMANQGTPDPHYVRWRSLFDQMDNDLSEEERSLESWLRQVKEMQSHCELGLLCMDKEGLDGRKRPRLKRDNNTLERECAVRAAAASIYSTCNFVMASENVSCF